MAAVFVSILILVKISKSLEIPKSHVYVKYIMKQTPIAYSTMLAFVVSAEVINYLQGVDTITGQFLIVYGQSYDTPEIKLSALLDMHERLSTTISDAYREINHNLNPERLLTNRLNAKDALTDPVMKDIHAKHDIIIDKVIQLHKQGTTTDKSYNGDNIMTYIHEFRKAFCSQKHRSGEYLKLLIGNTCFWKNKSIYIQLELKILVIKRLIM